VIDDAFDGAHGTGLSGFELIARLARVHPGGASLRYVAEHVVVSPSRVSRLAEELMARGWLRTSCLATRRPSLARAAHRRRAHHLPSMEATFAEAIRANLLDRLTQKQLDSIVAVCRSLGAPHC